MENCNPVPLTALTKEELESLEGKQHGDVVMIKGEEMTLRYSIAQEGFYLRPKWDE